MGINEVYSAERKRRVYREGNGGEMSIYKLIRNISKRSISFFILGFIVVTLPVWIIFVMMLEDTWEGFKIVFFDGLRDFWKGDIT